MSTRMNTGRSLDWATVAGIGALCLAVLVFGSVAIVAGMAEPDHGARFDRFAWNPMAAQVAVNNAVSQSQ
jgi:hypothetical protein